MKKYSKKIILFIEKLFSHISILIITGFLSFPFLMMIVTALKPYEDIISWPPKIFPTTIRWANFIEAWGGTYNLKQGFINSLIISLSSMVICIVVGSMAAYSLARFEFVGKKIFLFVMLITQMFAQVVLIIPLYIIMYKLKLLDTYIALIIPNAAFSLPMSIWMLTGFFKEISPNLEEAAMIDGCSRFQAIFKIIFPITAPSIVSVGIFAFINAWNDVLFSMIFINNPSMRPITLMLLDFKSQYQVNWNLLMAGAVFAVIPITILFIMIQKYLVKGLSSGAVKG